MGGINRASFEQKVLALVKEYCDEAEHGEGPEYWNEFSDVNQAVEDFCLYVENRED